MNYKLLFLFLLLVSFLSCDEEVKEGKRKKKVGAVQSAPYELLVVCDKGWYNSGSGKTFSTFGCIIFVNIGKEHTKEEVLISDNQYARPQVCVTINSPDNQGVNNLIAKHGQRILDIMTDNEMGRAMSILAKDYSPVVDNNARKMFGCTWHMPSEINLIKQGDRFFWASSPDNTLNACMYDYPITSPETFTKRYFCHKRDSFMYYNIKGEEWGQHMETDTSTVTVRDRNIKGNYFFEVHGLWDMKGDAMGGPFISYAQIDSVNNRVIAEKYFGVPLGIPCAILLGVSIVVHELAHSLTSRAFGCRIQEIRLSILGGCASGEIPRGARKEFLVAAAGPLSSLALGFGMFFFLYSSGVEIESRWLDSVLSYFGIMNFMLGLFNLLPGFPMDGGRMFRSAMRAFMSRERATYTAMIVGRAAAIALVVLPFFGINSIWIIPIGGDLVFRVLIAFMIWREGYREYLLAKMESSWDYSDYRARVSPPPYGGKEDDVDVRKN